MVSKLKLRSHARVRRSHTNCVLCTLSERFIRHLGIEGVNTHFPSRELICAGPISVQVVQVRTGYEPHALHDIERIFRQMWVRDMLFQFL